MNFSSSGPRISHSTTSFGSIVTGWKYSIFDLFGIAYENVTNGSKNESGIFNIEEWDNLSYGALLVFMEMSLTLLSIVFNLIVLISIREKESLLNSTMNVALANLCFSNLISAVFVKSIAVIYNGYAVASAKWEVELAFCTIHSVSMRATWAVFPYTIIVLSWLGLITKASLLFKLTGSSSSSSLNKSGYLTTSVSIVHQQLEMEELKTSIEVVNEANQEEIEHQIDEDDTNEGLSGRQKSVLGFIWFVAGVYSLLSPSVMSKEKFTTCSLRNKLDTTMNIASLLIAIPIPIVFGPIICTIGSIVLTFCGCVCSSIPGNRISARETQLVSTTPSTFCLTLLLTIIFLIVYPCHMYITEEYFGHNETIFAYMALKYVFGCMHMVLIPIFILLTRKDIWKAAHEVLSKNAVSTTNDEITFEQFQTHCGMGVQPS